MVGLTWSIIKTQALTQVIRFESVGLFSGRTEGEGAYLVVDLRHRVDFPLVQPTLQS